MVRKIQFEISFSNRWLYTFIALGIIILLGVIVYGYTSSSTGAGHGLNELEPCADAQILQTDGNNWVCVDSIWGIYHNNGNVGIKTDTPGAVLDVNGKIKMRGQIVPEDSDDTVATKSYVDSRNNNCFWRNGKECSSGELMNGWSSTQVHCCGPPLSCTETGWSTYNSVCSVSCDSLSCGVKYGSWRNYQSKTLADCGIIYQTVTGSSCSKNCGGCPYGYMCSSSRPNTCIDAGIG